jgi:hypothetical protein
MSGPTFSRPLLPTQSCNHTGCPPSWFLARLPPPIRSLYPPPQPNGERSFTSTSPTSDRAPPTPPPQATTRFSSPRSPISFSPSYASLATLTNHIRRNPFHALSLQSYSPRQPPAPLPLPPPPPPPLPAPLLQAAPPAPQLRPPPPLTPPPLARRATVAPCALRRARSSPARRSRGRRRVRRRRARPAAPSMPAPTSPTSFSSFATAHSDSFNNSFPSTLLDSPSVSSPSAHARRQEPDSSTPSVAPPTPPPSSPLRVPDAPGATSSPRVGLPPPTRPCPSPIPPRHPPPRSALSPSPRAPPPPYSMHTGVGVAVPNTPRNCFILPLRERRHIWLCLKDQFLRDVQAHLPREIAQLGLATTDLYIEQEQLRFHGNFPPP